MSNQQHCLNCNEPISLKFCSNCGQKTDTHRITFKNFITNDILHGVWHFERGIFFTIKEALIRPGKAAIDYISGKRIRYYNVFYLILLLIGLNLFLNHYYDVLTHVFNKTPNKFIRNDIGERIDVFLRENAKILIYLFVPFFALNGFLIFRRKKLNLSEHFIIAGITFLGIMLIITIINLISFFYFTNSFELISEFAIVFTPIFILLYSLYSYFTAYKKEYSFIGFSLRMLLFIFLLAIELMVIMFLIYGYVTDWKFGHLVY